MATRRPAPFPYSTASPPTDEQQQSGDITGAAENEDTTDDI